MSMSGSLIKYADRLKDDDGKRLFWGRAEDEGAPFRGPAAPVLTEGEFEQRTHQVVDVKNGFFDVRDKSQNKQFLGILDAAANGWFRVLYIERFVKGTSEHYVEWAEFYREDGTRSPHPTMQGMEVSRAVHADGNGGLPANGV